MKVVLYRLHQHLPSLSGFNRCVWCKIRVLKIAKKSLKFLRYLNGSHEYSDVDKYKTNFYRVLYMYLPMSHLGGLTPGLRQPSTQSPETASQPVLQRALHGVPQFPPYHPSAHTERNTVIHFNHIRGFVKHQNGSIKQMEIFHHSFPYTTLLPPLHSWNIADTAQNPKQSISQLQH